MPTLGQPDASIYSDIKLPKPLNIGGDQPAGRVAGPNAAMARLASEQQKDQQIQQLAQQYLGDPANPDYDGMVKAVTAVDPERGLKMQSTLAEARTNEAKSRLAQTESSLKSMTWVEDGVKLAIQDPTQYPKLLQSLAKQPGGSQFLQYAPDPNDPDLKAKLQNLLPVFVDTKDFQKVSQQSYRDYLNGDLELSAVRKLAAADTPDKRQLVDSELKGAGLSDYSTQYPDAASASQAFTALVAQKQQEKPASEKSVQQAEFEVPGRGRIKGFFDPNANNGQGAYYDSNHKEITNAKGNTPASLMGGGGAGAPEIQIKPGTRHYRTAVDLASGALPLADFQRMFGRGQQLAGLKEAMYDTAKQINPEFSPAAYEMGLKVASNPKIVQQVGSINNVLSGVPDLLAASNAASSSGARLLNSYIPKGGLLVGGKAYSNLRTARTAFADELSGALGYGSATDMSREMGFDMTDTTLSPDKFQSAIQDIVIPFVNRKKKSITDTMGVYGKPGMSPAAGPASKFSVTDPNGKVHPFDTQAQADAFKKLAGVK